MSKPDPDGLIDLLTAAWQQYTYVFGAPPHGTRQQIGALVALSGYKDLASAPPRAPGAPAPNGSRFTDPAYLAAREAAQKAGWIMEPSALLAIVAAALAAAAPALKPAYGFMGDHIRDLAEQEAALAAAAPAPAPRGESEATDVV